MQYITLGIDSTVIGAIEFSKESGHLRVHIPISENDGITAELVKEAIATNNTGMIRSQDENGDVLEEYYGYIIISAITENKGVITVELTHGTIEECIDDLYKKFNSVVWLNHESLGSVARSVTQNDDIIMRSILNNITGGN